VPVLIAVCVLSLSACQDEVLACSPSPPPVRVDVSGLQPRTATIRTCQNENCTEFFALAKLGRQLAMPSRFDLPTTFRLDVAVGGRITQTYEIADLTLRKPSGKGCDPGESVVLVPAAGGRLVVLSRYDPGR
jgi:hypothetical protein